MRMIDLQCRDCGYLRENFLQRAGMRELPYTCPKCHHKTLGRVHLQCAAVHGDEIDIYIKHGLCHADGTPRRYTSKSDLRRDTKAAGLINIVEHIPSPGSDKNRKRNTQRFI